MPSFQKMIAATGAVVMDRKAFAMGDPDSYAANYEFQIPIFVLIHSIPKEYPKESDTLSFTFVITCIESAIAQAKKAAGDKDTQVIGGATTIQQCLNAGSCDELHIDIMPILLGDGLWLFENLNADKITLERVKVAETTLVRAI